MSKRLKRYINVENYRASDDEIRAVCPERICIWYGFNNYECNMTHINALCDAVRSEYPDMENKDMEVRVITHGQSRAHEGHTTLRVPIPVEDFIRLRQAHEIGIL